MKGLTYSKCSINKSSLLLFIFTYLLVENIHLLNYLHSCQPETTMSSSSPGDTSDKVHYMKTVKSKTGSSAQEAAICRGLAREQFKLESSEPSKDNTSALWWILILTSWNFLWLHWRFPVSLKSHSCVPGATALPASFGL